MSGTGPGSGLALRRNEAEAILDRAVRRWAAARRARIDGFAAHHLGPAGAARLHAHALGWDLLRAPLNLALALPHVATRLAGLAAGRAGFPHAAGRLRRIRILRETRVARELRFLVMAELLELPAAMPDGRRASRDSLAGAILAEPEVAALAARAAEAAAARRDDPAFRAAIAANLAEYAGSRAAAAEITTALLTVGAGALLFQQATPGMVTLGPALAAALAQSAAIASFPLGATLGGLWYGTFPAAAPAGLVLGTTLALAGTAALVSAFAGLLADPVQTALGLHQRRLRRLVDAVEAGLLGRGDGDFRAREHYLVRLLDLADLLAGVLRAARG